MTSNSPDAGVDVGFVLRNAREIARTPAPSWSEAKAAIKGLLNVVEQMQATSPPSRETEAARQKIIDAAMKWHGANIDYPDATVALANAVKEYRALHKGE